jgi:hypothetical protein
MEEKEITNPDKAEASPTPVLSFPTMPTVAPRLMPLLQLLHIALHSKRQLRTLPSVPQHQRPQHSFQA